MQIELSAEQVVQIAYALRELASRRQEQSLDYRYNTIAKRANADEARSLRRLSDAIMLQAKHNEQQNR